MSEKSEDRMDEFLKEFNRIAKQDISFPEKKMKIERVAKKMDVSIEIELSKKTEYGYKGERAKRISIYLYPAQLEMIEKICKKRGKTKRWIFMEAIQIYIGMFLKDKVWW